MKIKYGKAENQNIEFATKNVSIIGENGSGKSSLMRDIKKYNQSFVVISAHKNLIIRQGSYKGQDDVWLSQNMTHFENPTKGSGDSPYDNNSLQIDFNQMIEKIFRDYTDETVRAFNSGKKLEEIDRRLDTVFRIWNLIFLDKKLSYENKKIMAKPPEGDHYEIENLSDGERVALYILVKLSLSNSGGVIVIDEPETFLNPALLDNLFDECEKFKSDASFVYFSHDLEFISTRKNNTILWIKEFKYPDSYKIEPVIPEDIPEELIMKIIGTKKQKILFVESNSNEDAKLYQLLYKDFKVWPVDGCENVINYTKAFNSRTEKFNKEYFGLIDRDLKDDDWVGSLKEHKIYSLPVAIYDNIFLHKDIIKFVFEHLGKSDFETKFPDLVAEIKKQLDKENFKLGYRKLKIQQLFNKNINSIANGETQITFDSKPYDLEIDQLKNKEYEEIIKIFNQKDLKGCVSKLGFTWSEWQEQVLNIFNTDKEEKFKEEFFKFMPQIQ